MMKSLNKKKRNLKRRMTDREIPGEREQEERSGNKSQERMKKCER
jgi:hypothetical protein